MHVVKAPRSWHCADLGVPLDSPKIFLAGSIEMGKAELWQDRVCEELQDIENGIIFNPRRDNWDSSWEQSIDDPNFVEQVEWELDHLFIADYRIFYFQPETKSPITLMELGRYVARDNCFVVCPKGFWRKGNVDIITERFDHPMYEDLDTALKDLRDKLGEK